MGFLSSIKRSLYARALAEKAKAFTKQRRFNGWETVEVCSILFEQKGDFDIPSIMKFADKLRDQGKTVHLLCYTGKEIKEGLAYKSFSVKDISFNLTPKSNVVSIFTNRHSDILYNLIPLKREISEYISISANADFKIGLFDESRTGLDLMINLKINEFKEFIKTADRVLQKTNK